MPRRPNQSGLGPTNTLEGVGVDFKNLERRAQRSTVQSETGILRAGELINELDALEEAMDLAPAGSLSEKQLQSRQSRLQNRLASVQSRSDMMQRSQVERVANLTQSQVAASYSSRSINGQSINVSRSSMGISGSMSMMSTPWEDLERRKGSLQNTVANLGQRALNISEGLYNSQGEQDPQRVRILQKLEARRNSAVNEMGTIDAAMRSQRSQGMDPQSRANNLYNVGAQARGMLGQQSLSDEMRGGSINIMSGGKAQSVSMGDVNKELAEQARGLTKALMELETATDKTREGIKKEAEERAANFEKLREVAGMGGGGASGSQKLAAAAGAFGALGGAAQEIFVNQRLQQVANVSGLANIENQKYDTYRSASAGNIASQLQLSQYAAAQGFGGSLAKGQLTALGLQAAGGVAQTGAGVGQAIEGGAEKWNPITYALGTNSGPTNEMLQGGLNAVQGAATTATTGFDIGRGLSTTSARIAGVNSYMEATKALSYVGAEQLQGFRDFSVGASVAAQGMGRAGTGFLNRAISTNNLSRMAESRIGPEQFNQMAQQGVQSMGSMFNENQIFAARGLERSGMGTMQENMQRMSQLAAAGSNNPQASLGNVLEAAVSKGMDSSKAINMMVDHTAAMAASSVGRAMGMDTSAAAATMLGSMVSGPNKEASLARAISLQDTIKGIGTNTDMSFSGMVATSRLSQSLGIDTTAAIRLQRVDTETLKSLDTPSKRADFFKERNVNTTGKDTKMMVDSMLDDRAATLLEGGGIGFTETGRDALLKRVKKFGGKMSVKDLTQSEQNTLGTGVTSGNFNTISEVLGSLNQVYATNEPNAKSRVQNDMTGKGGGALMQTADDMRTQGFKQLSQAALEATKGFKSAADALKALGVLAKSVEGIGDNGGEGKFKGAAAASAESFGKATMQFDTSVSTFSKAVSVLASKAGLRTNEESDLAKKTENLFSVPNFKTGHSTR